MAQKFKVEGLKELEEALKELPRATARNVLLRTLKKEAKPIADAASQLAPDDPRTKGKDLRESILIASVPAKKRESDVEVAVGPATRAFYGAFQEFGAPQHGPKPFLRPAGDQNVMGVLKGIRNTLADEIEKVRKRIAKKAEREAAKLKA
jgi:HK97 gp10 family phage protein